MKIPNQLRLQDIQESFREVERQIEPLRTGNINMSGRRVIGAGNSIAPFDYVTRFELEEFVADKTSEQTNEITGMLNSATEVRIGTYAQRGAATAHASQLFLASDRDYIGFISTGSIWAFAFGVHRDAIANIPTPTADEANYAFYATDTFRLYYWNGAAWIEDILSELEKFGGLTASFPALKRSAAILQARLADDSAYTDLEVLDEAYGAGWDGSVEVPTKNAVYDKIQTLLGSTAYTPTNVSADRDFDANGTSIDEIADVLGTLISDLQSKGILS